MADNFDWNDAGPLVVREARDMVVYRNTSGDLVIRQRPLVHDEDDSTVFVPLRDVRALIERLENLLSGEKDS